MCRWIENDNGRHYPLGRGLRARSISEIDIPRALRVAINAAVEFLALMFSVRHNTNEPAGLGDFIVQPTRGQMVDDDIADSGLSAEQKMHDVIGTTLPHTDFADPSLAVA